MSASVNPEPKPKATRQSFGESLAELGAKNSRIVVLEADLGKSTKSEIFGKKFPERYFEMGIAEANMISTGAGLALSGHKTFICSFGCFVTGRYDQIRMSIAYANANVCVVGTHAGIGIGDDGHSQMGLEDLSLMRELPGMIVFQPCDDIETKQMMEFIASHQGPSYLRLTRQALASVHDSTYRFRVGKTDILNQGQKIALIGTGAGVQECKAAWAQLKMKNVNATLANVHTLKPFDVEGVLDLARNHEILVTVEDHYTTGGLGSAVSEALAQHGREISRFPRLLTLGVQDCFGESGEPVELYEKFGFSSAQIVGRIVELI